MYRIHQFVFWKGTRQPLRVTDVRDGKVEVEEIVAGQPVRKWVDVTNKGTTNVREVT